jgi:microcystin-dependent protein
MSNPYIGEIRMFAGSFAPAGWAMCDGQLIPISENDALFTLIGTTYGGDGQETFALPNLQSRIPMHMGTAKSGTTYTIGEAAGVEQVTLTTQQIPTHNHAFLATTDSGAAASANNAVVGSGTAITIFRPGGAGAVMSNQSIGPAGGSQPHDNMQPFLCINYIISLFGLFPNPN